MMKELKLKKFWLSIGLCYIGVIFYLCLRKTVPSEPLFEHMDKIFHFSAYFFLMGYFSQIVNKDSLKKSFIIFFLMGLLIEFLQLMTGYRSFELLDVLANTTGLTVGLLLFGIIFPNILVTLEKMLNFKNT